MVKRTQAKEKEDRKPAGVGKKCTLSSGEVH